MSETTPDPTFLEKVGKSRFTYKVDGLVESGQGNATPAGDWEPAPISNANLVSSLCRDGRHRPALDIDVPCVYVKSSTEGHGHLYFPSISLSTDDYFKLLDALVEVGIVDRRYARWSKDNGQSTLRPPWVQKSKADR